VTCLRWAVYSCPGLGPSYPSPASHALQRSVASPKLDDQRSCSASCRRTTALMFERCTGQVALTTPRSAAAGRSSDVGIMPRESASWSRVAGPSHSRRDSGLPTDVHGALFPDLAHHRANLGAQRKFASDRARQKLRRPQSTRKRSGRALTWPLDNPREPTECAHRQPTSCAATLVAAPSITRRASS